jgi:phage major head subunit gpT-like protein
MATVTSDIPRLIEAGLKATFYEEVDTGRKDYERLCTRVDTTQETQDYGWVAGLPTMREFTDERVPKGLMQYGTKITDKTWEATIGVSRRAIENDQYGQIMIKVRELAREALDFVNRRALIALRESNSATGAASYGRSWDNYDKDGTQNSATIYFADTDHSYPKPAKYTTSQANKAANALSGANLGLAINAMLTWKPENFVAADANTHRYVARNPDLLIVPPKLQWTARELLNNAQKPDATYNTGNVYQGIVDLMVAPEWAADVANNTQNWGLACTTGVTKPLILQVFTPATSGGSIFEFSSLEGNSEAGFMRDMYYYGVRSRFEIGYGDWRNWYLNVVA